MASGQWTSQTRKSQFPFPIPSSLFSALSALRLLAFISRPPLSILLLGDIDERSFATRGSICITVERFMNVLEPMWRRRHCVKEKSCPT